LKALPLTPLGRTARAPFRLGAIVLVIAMAAVWVASWLANNAMLDWKWRLWAHLIGVGILLYLMACLCLRRGRALSRGSFVVACAIVPSVFAWGFEAIFLQAWIYQPGADGIGLGLTMLASLIWYVLAGLVWLATLVSFAVAPEMAEK
jgi:hypothetical protein